MVYLNNIIFGNRKESISLIAKYMRGYLDFIRYGRMNRFNATNKYFDDLRANIEKEAGIKITQGLGFLKSIKLSKLKNKEKRERALQLKEELEQKRKLDMEARERKRKKAQEEMYRRKST